MTPSNSLKNRLLQTIRAFINSAGNSLSNADGDPAFAEPLVGFARGDDRIFTAYKQHVGPFHWTPLEAFHQGYPDQEQDPSQLTVVSWVLPQTARTRSDNRRETFYPSESWARARYYGEAVNEELRRQVAAFFRNESIVALAPVLLPAWSRMDSDRFVWASTWSERHMAYAAGLGTFGLCDGLITPKGKAMRVGSVLAATADLPVSPRLYTDHHAYCLFFSSGTCRSCIERCPVGAISENGHDKRLCRDHVHRTANAYVKETYGFDGYGCGLCQTGVPCESRIPVPDNTNPPAVGRRGRTDT